MNPAFQNFLRQTILDLVLQCAPERSGPVFFIISLVYQEIPGRLIYLQTDGHLAADPLFHARQHDVHDLSHVFLGQGMEYDGFVDTV